MDYQYRGPRYSDGPFCVVEVLRTREGLETYTYRRPNGSAWVDSAGTLVNGIRSGTVPTWMIRRDILWRDL